MGQMEDLSASLAATKESVDELSLQMLQNEGIESALAAILNATKEQTAGIGKHASSLRKQNAELRKEVAKQNAELRKDVLKQNADYAVLMLKQSAALISAVQEQTKAIERQTKAIEKQAAPARESGKRKRVEETAADAGNERETSATDSQTSAAEKLLSSSLNGKGLVDAGEGTSTARRKKMKAPAPSPVKEVLSVNATECTCTWTISNFSKLKLDKNGEKSSDIFSIGGHKWKLRLYPRGEGYVKGKFICLFLKLADDRDKLPQGWQVPVDLSFYVICQHDPEKNWSFHGIDDKPDTYDRNNDDFGWHEFLALTDFHDDARGFLVNDTVTFKAKIEVKEVVSVNATSPTEGTCTWRIPNFSKLKLNKWGEKSSDIFSIGGHKWKLEVNPRGDWSGKGKSVSLYLYNADDTHKLPKGWKVTAAFSLSVICQHDPEKSRKNEGSKNWEFHAKGDNWGFLNLISVTDLQDAAKGFLVNDTVIIEAKIEVLAPATVAVSAPAKDVVSVNATGPHEGTCTWRIPKFSKLRGDWAGRKTSRVFSIGGHKWKLRLYPKGRDSAKDKSVSLYLYLVDDTDKLPKDRKVTADFSLSVMCQHNPEKSRKEEGSKNREFSASKGWGFDNFIPLTDFHDAAKGFLVNDTANFEAKIQVKTR